MKIIEIAGRGENGKSRTASILTYHFENIGKKCATFSFAAPLKDFCKKYKGWNGVKDSAGRSILQLAGEEARKENPDTWVNITIELLKGFGKNYDYIFIDDFRYRNEFLKMKSSGFNPFTVYVHRNDFQNSLSPEQRLHHSETSLLDFKFDYMISVESKMVKLIDATKLMIERNNL
jgi:hypothetical protein